MRGSIYGIENQVATLPFGQPIRAASQKVKDDKHYWLPSPRLQR